MAARIRLHIALVATVVSTAACGNFRSAPPRAGLSEPAPTADTIAPESPAARCIRNGPIATVDAYKIGVARHILRSNLGHTFDGQLPPMLPAIVVLRLSVDNTGNLTDVFVQRSRDEVASAAAMASIRRSGTFPLPCGLIVRPDGTLSFSETFLFNGQYQFQLRSLAGPQ
jgi:protein TonB